MQETTRTAIRALIGADATTTEPEKEAITAALDGLPLTADARPMPSVISAQKAAELTNLTTRSLRSYARRGLLRPAYYAGSSRAWGYSAESVRTFIESATAGGTR